MAEPLVDYTVQGLVNETQIFETRDQYMEEDITILKVPTYEVSGPNGGITIIIGED